MPLPADWIVPDWPAPPRVRSLVTTRNGGTSNPPYDSMNLAAHLDDDAAAVRANRERLRVHLPAEPCWLQQVHGTRVVEADAAAPASQADACVARGPRQVCAVVIADCLPVLLCDRAGTTVAAAHAGWRGLSAGVLERTVAVMGREPSELLAYLGPAIGPQAFEVQTDVLDAFTRALPRASECFRAKAAPADAPRKWLADLYGLARQRLAGAGVQAVYGGGSCTFSEPDRFFSHRRDRHTGRQAALIWIDG
jgi:purine-nucleoside/S-methyl-5'-thioadenosine phosphorylase / adenosine deaminase